MTTESNDRTPATLLSNPEFVALASVKFASGMAFATIIIALALYADVFAVSGLVAGLFGTAYAVTRLFLVLPIGRYVDVGDAKRYLLAGMGLNLLVLIGFTFASAVEHVIALRAFQGGGSILLLLAGTAIVGQIAPDDERGLWIGTFNQAKSFSSLSGDIVGGALLFLYGFRTTYIVLIAVGAVATVAVFLFVRENPGGQADAEETTGTETLRLLLGRSTVRALVVFRFAFSFGKMAVIIFLPIYARTVFGMNALAIGGILAGGKLTKALAQGHVGTVSDRIGHLSWFIFAGTILYAVGTSLIPFATYGSAVLPSVPLSIAGREMTLVPGFFVLFTAYAILGIADSLRLPTSMALFVEEGEHYDAVAGSLSLRSVSWQVGAIVGPLAVGAMLDYLSYFAAFWLASAFMVVAGTIFVNMYATEPAPADAVASADD